jgi:PEP-CTERM motif
MRNPNLVIITIGAALALSARADFFDNFDSYTTGSLNNQGGWVVDTGTLNVTSANSVSAPNSVVWASSASSRAHRAVGGSGELASKIDFSFQFNDVGATRDFNSLYAYSGGWLSGLQTVVAIGDFNTGVTGKYMGRYSAITGAVYGDGAVATTGDGGTGGWFSLTGAANKVNGWHLFDVQGSVDPDHAGKAKLWYYVDGVLGGSVANLPDYSLTWATIGGAVSVGITGGNTDDYSVGVVPEPSTAALAILGGSALALGVISRRRKN